MSEHNRTEKSGLVREGTTGVFGGRGVPGVRGTEILPVKEQKGVRRTTEEKIERVKEGKQKESGSLYPQEPDRRPVRRGHKSREGIRSGIRTEDMFRD